MVIMTVGGKMSKISLHAKKPKQPLILKISLSLHEHLTLRWPEYLWLNHVIKLYRLNTGIKVLYKQKTDTTAYTLHEMRCIYKCTTGVKALLTFTEVQAFLLSPPAPLSVTILSQQHYDKDRLKNSTCCIPRALRKHKKSTECKTKNLTNGIYMNNGW
jgi:hypothetical protein